MSFMNNILSKTGIAALAVGVVMALSPIKADAATIVVQGGGPYDITSDNVFLGIAIAGGGAGSYAVDFTSSVDPLDAIANASVTTNVFGVFGDLTMQWVNTDTNVVLSSTLVAVPTTTLLTTFGTPNLNQSIVFTWTSSTNGAGFDFDVSAVPLPAGGLLLLTALGGVAALRRKRKAV